MTAAIGKRLEALETLHNSKPIGGLVIVQIGESVLDALRRCNISGSGRGFVVVPAKFWAAQSQQLVVGDRAAG
jgi:hypothetical protein